MPLANRLAGREGTGGYGVRATGTRQARLGLCGAGASKTVNSTCLVHKCQAEPPVSGACVASNVPCRQLPSATDTRLPRWGRVSWVCRGRGAGGSRTPLR